MSEVEEKLKNAMAMFPSEDGRVVDIHNLASEALEKIAELKAENEILSSDILTALREVKTLKAENEKLRSELEKSESCLDNEICLTHVHEIEIATLKSEAAKVDMVLDCWEAVGKEQIVEVNALRADNEKLKGDVVSIGAMAHSEIERLKGDEAWLEHRLTKTLMDAEKGRAERCIRLTTERAEVLEVLERIQRPHLLKPHSKEWDMVGALVKKMKGEQE